MLGKGDIDVDEGICHQHSRPKFFSWQTNENIIFLNTILNISFLFNLGFEDQQKDMIHRDVKQNIFYFADNLDMDLDL